MDALISNEMTEAEYDRQRAELRATYGDSAREAGIRREQALARLFHQSGWTQEHLAQKEGVSLAEASRRLIFGRFLDFSPIRESAENPVKTLTQGRFFTYWRQTDTIGNERKRFQKVLDLIAADATIEKAGASDLPKKIIDEYGDGEWHLLATVVDFLGEDEKVCAAALEKVAKNKTFQCKVERKPYGASFKFVIYRQHDAVGIPELVQKLGPIIKELVEEGKKGPARISGQQVTALAVRLQHLLDEWRE
jgi:transcriptional regulator with XRE-family HTH domain